MNQKPEGFESTPRVGPVIPRMHEPYGAFCAHSAASMSEPSMSNGMYCEHVAELQASTKM